MGIEYSRKGDPINLQAERYADVTKSDETTFVPSTLFVGTTGDVAIKNSLGESVVLKNIANGSFLPVICIQVLSTGTTASNIVRIW